MVETISVKNALRLASQGKAVLFDVRDKNVYINGHIPDAVLLTEATIGEELIKAVRNGKKAVLYCDYGNQSMKLADQYKRKGVPFVLSLAGGYHAYKEYLQIQKDSLGMMEQT